MSRHITAQGYAALKTEHGELWLRRREVVAALSAAAAEGDRSENAEYIYRKKELREVDRRLRYLSRRLRDLVVVDTLPADRERIWFGAWVELEREDGSPFAVRIVGSDETRAEAGWISVDAPLARALLGRRLDEEVEVRLPAGRERFLIAAIDYREEAA